MVLQHLLGWLFPSLVATLIAWTVNGVVLRQMLQHLCSSDAVIWASPQARVTTHSISSQPLRSPIAAPAPAVQDSTVSTTNSDSNERVPVMTLTPYLPNPSTNLSPVHTTFPCSFRVFERVMEKRHDRVIVLEEETLREFKSQSGDVETFSKRLKVQVCVCRNVDPGISKLDVCCGFNNGVAFCRWRSPTWRKSLGILA